MKTRCRVTAVFVGIGHLTSRITLRRFIRSVERVQDVVPIEHC
jgi:hypothetical protein